MTILEMAQKPRYELINRLLLDEFVLIHLDPKHEGVIVPLHLHNQEILTLKLSKLFRGRIELSKDKIEADLLFGDDYFTCAVPLEAIWGATSQQGKTQVWKENLPKSIVVPEGSPKTAVAAKAKVAKLDLSDSPSFSPTETSKSEAKTNSPQKKGHLTRVK